MRDLLLTAHVVLGVTALLLGPLWLVLRRRGAAAVGAAVAYQATVAVVALSGAWLAVTAPGLQWLAPIAVLTETLAVTGALARRRRWQGWRSWQPHLLGGSYIALVTALLVAETGVPIFWVLPAVVGQWPIAVAKHRLHDPALALA
jgi:hypothetical protein